jgi:hypothetical protein
MADPPTPTRILQLGLGYQSAKVLLSAVELGLFTELAKQPLDAEQLRARLALHPRSARDFFDTLVALGMLERDGSVYRNTSETDRFLDRAKPSYIGGYLEMHNARMYPFWGSLTEGLRTGQPQNEAKTGGNFFEVLYRDPARLREFLRAMTAFSAGSALAIAQRFRWSQYQTFVDIGAAEGGLLVQVVLTQSHLTGGGVDLPAVGPIFREYVASHHLEHRLAFYPGDFFTDPLPEAEVYSMGHILHDWSLDDKKYLLSKVYGALPAGGALIVFDSLIDDERRTNAWGLLRSLTMLIETTGGFDYTGADCRGWMQEVGFRQTYVEPLGGPDSLVVGIK